MKRCKDRRQIPGKLHDLWGEGGCRRGLCCVGLGTGGITGLMGTQGIRGPLFLLTSCNAYQAVRKSDVPKM